MDIQRERTEGLELSFHFPLMTKVLFQYKERSYLIFVTGLITSLNN